MIGVAQAILIAASGPVVIARLIRAHRLSTTRLPQITLPAERAPLLGRVVRGDARIGLGLIVVPVGLVAPVLGIAVLFAGVARLRWRARRREHDRIAELARELPEIVDLYSIALSGGHNILSASNEVASRGDGQVAHTLRRSLERVEQGQPLDVAIEALHEDLGPPLRPLTNALLSALRYGVPIVDSLTRVAADLRLEERRRAEQAARRLPVTMLVPLVLCVLPAFGLLTVVPVLIRSLQSVSLS